MKPLRISVLGSLFPSAFAAQVQLGSTTIVGRDLSESGLGFFGGIPFAESPVGSLRFEPPALKVALNVSTFDASNFGPSCIQPTGASNDDDEGIDQGEEQSEDCLSVNIYRPSGLNGNGSTLPILFWIHGGGFWGGSTSKYNATTFVSNSINRGTPLMFVSVNYRLGPFGFPPGLEATQKGSLNLGLKDQLAGLQWVQKNIAAFGGDKSKVTVMGSSAGSISISIHFLNEQFADLARAAIFQSGFGSTASPFDATENQNAWDQFASSSGCGTTLDTISCLQSKTTKDLTSAYLQNYTGGQTHHWLPTLDGPDGLFPSYPTDFYEQGQFAKLPFIAGCNLDETAKTAPHNLNNSSLIKLTIIANWTGSPQTVLPTTLALNADKLVNLYPDFPAAGSPYGTGNETWGFGMEWKRIASIYGDLLWHAQRRNWMQYSARKGVTSYGYHFTQTQVPRAPVQDGVFHGAQNPYVFGTITNATESDLRLSQNIMDYYASFVTSLNPNDGNGSQRQTWSAFSMEDQTLLQLDGENSTLIPDDYRGGMIQFIMDNPKTFRL